MQNHDNQNEEDLNEGLPEDMIRMIKKMIMKKSGQECSVCFNKFCDGKINTKLILLTIFR